MMDSGPCPVPCCCCVYLIGWMYLVNNVSLHIIHYLSVYHSCELSMVASYPNTVWMLYYLSIILSRWNFTVSQLQMMMIEGEDDSDFSCQQDRNQLNLHVSDGARMLYLTKRYDWMILSICLFIDQICSSSWECWSFKVTFIVFCVKVSSFLY